MLIDWPPCAPCSCIRPRADRKGLLEWGALYVGLFQAIEGLPPAALDWVPGPDTNSLAVLAVHVTGATRYWIGDVAGRDRDAEFQVRDLDATALKARLTEALAYHTDLA